MNKQAKITKFTHMTNQIWKMLHIDIASVVNAIGKTRDENAQLAQILGWAEQFGEDKFVSDVKRAIAKFNEITEGSELRKIAQDHGLTDNFYMSAEEQAAQIRDFGHLVF